MQTITSRIKRSNPARPCPVCGGTGCGQAGTLTLCWRVESAKQARSGAYIHGDGVPYRQQLIARTAPLLASIEQRHLVFSALLARLSLTAAHLDHLRTVRGLSTTAINAAQFVTVPDYVTAQTLVAELADEFDLCHVPGFYAKSDHWRLRFAGMPGFYIPLRDAQGRIQALQIRRDTDDPKFRYCLVSTPPDEFPQGASSGAPTHFAGSPACDRLVITEGGLKATICADLLGYGVAGLVGAGTFKETFGWQLRKLLPSLRAVALALDADAATNPQVAPQLKRLHQSLTSAGFPVHQMKWPAALGKGLDDYLLSQKRGVCFG